MIAEVQDGDCLPEMRQTAATLYQKGRYEEAVALIKPLLTSPHVDAQLLNLAAACCLSMGRAQEAAGLWQQMLDRQPNHYDALNNLGVVLSELDRMEDAEACFRRALAVTPGHPGAYINIGRLFARLRRFEEAEHAYRHAIVLQPQSFEAWQNLGVMYREQRRLPEAASALGHALAENPHDASTHFDLGVVLTLQKRLDEAETSYRQVLALSPHHFEAKQNLAHLLLSLGKFEEGWELYETRYDPAWPQRVVTPPAVDYPVWRGEDLSGKSLLVYSEQGHGDSLQFCRYLTALKACGLSKLTVVCSEELQPLLELIAGVDLCISPERLDSAPRHDYLCLMMSLPCRFRTTLHCVPASTPYLRVPRERIAKWAGRLPGNRFKVGLVWAGAPRVHRPELNAVDRLRSFDAITYIPLLRIPGITFVSLQKGETTQMQINAIPADLRPLDLMHDVHDFADTAAIIEQLDLVITVDTAIAHLAGALDKPVWILSRNDACWRWLNDRDDSPWYPSARLFRQPSPGHWDEVISRVTCELANRAFEFSRRVG
ncbi:tetratricopeptide repeat-containing glycosyltransferase family protein [Paraburkholderia sp. J41]|uniref:tetratricopeptide repeat-containing glycosyltransferase family protein n=1 Tax=Paraburkholderia sp. J41 TaxID=2805433 RepID=UPI002AC35A99|nr:tetratricopeptide repeat-containing glycosyltransferase family protein [Paraburkholderia sp. J41]